MDALVLDVCNTCIHVSSHQEVKIEREREREGGEGERVCVGGCIKERQLTILGMFAAGFSPLLSLTAFAKVLNIIKRKLELIEKRQEAFSPITRVPLPQCLIREED